MPRGASPIVPRPRPRCSAELGSPDADSRDRSRSWPVGDPGIMLIVMFNQPRSVQHEGLLSHLH